MLLIKCPNCGFENPDTATGCGDCGEPLPKKEVKSQPKKESQSKAKSNSSNTKIIAVVAIIVIIAIVGVVASGMLSNTPSDNVNVDDKSNVVSPVADNNTSDKDSSSHTEYWASAKAEKFHLPTCEWAQKISDSNKIVYQSRNDAIEDGKVPCTACNP